MTNWTTIFMFEVRQQFRRKSYLFMTFVLPLVVLVGFFGYQAYTNATEPESDTAETNTQNFNTKAAVGMLDLSVEGLFPPPETYPSVQCDQTDSEKAVWNASHRLTDSIAAMIKRTASPYCRSNAFQWVDSLDAGKQLVEDGDLDVLYVIEPDFAQTGAVSMYISGFNIEAFDSDALAKDFILRSLLYAVPEEDAAVLYPRLSNPSFIGVHKLANSQSAASADGEAGADAAQGVAVTASENEEQNFVLIYVFGLATIMSVFWGGGYLMQSVVQEKESRIVEIVLSSTRPTALLFGKTLGMAVIALSQLATWITTAVIVISQAGDLVDNLKGVSIEPVSMVVLFVYFVLGFLFFGSLMAAIGAFSTTVREAQNFVVFVTLPAMIPFFVLTVFAQEPNGTLATGMSLFPLTAPLSMVMRVVVTDVPFGQILLSLALLIAAVAGAIWLAGRFFRVNTLLSGTMPKLRDIPKLIFG